MTKHKPHIDRGRRRPTDSLVEQRHGHLFLRAWPITRPKFLSLYLYFAATRYSRLFPPPSSYFKRATGKPHSFDFPTSFALANSLVLQA